MGTRSLVSPKITVTMSATMKNTLDDGSYGQASVPALKWGPAMTSGAGDDQANRGWQAAGTIEDGDIYILDLYAMSGIDVGAGAGLDALGQACDFENIVAIAVCNDNDPSDAGVLEVFPSADEGWSPIGIHTVATFGELKGDGILFKAQLAEGGFNVIDNDRHRVTLRATGGSVAWSVYLLARNDDELSSSSSSSSASSSSSSQSSSSVSTSSSSVSTSSISTSSVSSASSVSSSSSSLSSSSSSSSSQSSSSLSSVSTSSSSSP